MIYAGIAVWIGFLLDLAWGDPQHWPHPVRRMGKVIHALEVVLRAWFRKTRKGERIAGSVLAGVMLVGAFFISGALLYLCYHVHWVFGLAAESWLCYRMVSVRALRDESTPVCRALQSGRLPAAREAVSRIVGRDTEHLDEEGVAKAAVETVAENTSDGAVAPLFYMMLFGAVGGVVYKAANTMDSMIGYRNDRYRYFGTAAARIDDVLNFLPARICAVLIILCSSGPAYDRPQAVRIWRRDRLRHSSPNAAQSEAALAGALGIELAGDAVYFGKQVKKEPIGDKTRPIAPTDIILANRMLYRVSWAMMLLLGIPFGVLRGLIFVL